VGVGEEVYFFGDVELSSEPGAGAFADDAQETDEIFWRRSLVPFRDVRRNRNGCGLHLRGESKII